MKMANVKVIMMMILIIIIIIITKIIVVIIMTSNAPLFNTSYADPQRRPLKNGLL